MSARDKVRLTTERYFGATEKRLENLRSMFEYVEQQSPSQSDLIGWILSTTNAESEDAIKRRLDFLESIELLSQSDQEYSLTTRSERFLKDGEVIEILAGLVRNVSGFELIIPELASRELSDSDLAEILQTQDDFDGGPGVASRHREWLQSLGYLRETTNGKYTLTESGRREAVEWIDKSASRFTVGEIYRRQELHDEYGGNRQSGISPCADHPIIFIFTGEGGGSHGYHDEFRSDGTFVYTGEGQKGDMEFSRGNLAIRDHIENEDELHLFEQLGDGKVRYIGQFEYADHNWVRLPDTDGNERDAIRFKLNQIIADPSLVNVDQDNTNLETKESSIESPIEEYDDVTQATSDVLDRLQRADIQRSEFTDRISKTIVAAWTKPLRGIAVKTASEISSTDAILIKQIKDVYFESENWLAETAESLGIGSLYDLDPPQVLFMALLRDFQSDIPEISQVNVNHVKLKTIFNDEYSVRTPEAGGNEDEVEHVLLSAIDEGSDRAVHLFTAPPDYWLTAIRYRAVSFSETKEDQWRGISGGDIAIIHSRTEPGREDLDDQPNGLIAAGVLGEKYLREDEQWWWDEFEGNKHFPYIVDFRRLFVTGELGKIDETANIENQGINEVTAEMEALTANILPFSEINSVCKDKTGRGLGARGMFSTFRTDAGALEYERPRIVLEKLVPNLSECSPVNLYRDFYPDLSPALLDGLYFPDGQDAEIVQEIEAALRGGKHIILTGPPGTGKTEIARQVIATLEQSYPYLFSGSEITTATADWSTFDTVGGYMPSESAESETDGGEELSFTAGTILNRLRSRDPDISINEPLVIDELNRADIDKAFGQLFTVLSGQSVTLPQTKDGSEIEILPVRDLEGLPQDHQYVIPRSWRLFATMNTYDKTSLYEMSYAFMRRFAFIRVGVPSLQNLDGQALQELVGEYVAAWEHEDLQLDLGDGDLLWIGRVWQQTNTAVDDRAIGPAIIRDLVLYVNNHSSPQVSEKLTRAVIAYIFPQLEGVPKRKEIVESIAEVDAIDEDRLRAVAQEMLQITFEER